MLDTSDILSALALAGSAATAWFTMFRRGTVKMTQPAYIYLGPDGRENNGPPKVAASFHLYCTADRGRVLEGLHVRLKLGMIGTDFDVWVHGSSGLERGSGVYVGAEGKTCGHHFLLPRDDQSYVFCPGRYTVQFIGRVVGDAGPRKLSSVDLDLPPDAAAALAKGYVGVWFEWRPGRGRYELSVKSGRDRVASVLENLPPIIVNVGGGEGGDDENE